MKLLKRISLHIILLCFSLGVSAKSHFESAKLYSKAQLQQSFEACIDLFPESNTSYVEDYPSGYGNTELCSDSFAVLYSKSAKIPLVVVEKLNKNIIADGKKIPRSSNHFYPDPRIKKKDSADLKDYKGSGTDRGHMANSADMPCDQCELQSYALSNILPQHLNNRTSWRKIESDTRKYAERAKGNIYVFSGPIFNDGKPMTTIGKGKVWVPPKLFKLVYDESTHKAWAFIIENTDDAEISKPISYQEFVKLTGFKLINPRLIKD
jgi:endonuclease G